MAQRPSIDYAKKKQTNRDLVLNLLSDLGWHNNREMQAAGGGARYGARIRELRRLGYEIVSKEDADGIGKSYRLESLEPGEPIQKLVKVFIDPIDAQSILDCGKLSSEGQTAVTEALERYWLNKDKL